MFTGLVQKIGTLQRLSRRDGGWFLRLACDAWETPLELGESVAVQGACLTVVETGPDWFTADILDETMARTALRYKRTGARLNLERALAVGDRLGGHIVTGHVDAVGSVRDIIATGRDVELQIDCPREISDGTVVKGSIAIDGVSLTVISTYDGFVSVALIPHTFSSTSLQHLENGDFVNLESDYIGKYVAKNLGRSSNTGVTETLLKENGFL
jgi:riboflavin synthase